MTWKEIEELGKWIEDMNECLGNARQWIAAQRNIADEIGKWFEQVLTSNHAKDTRRCQSYMSCDFD